MQRSLPYRQMGDMVASQINLFTLEQSQPMPLVRRNAWRRFRYPLRRARARLRFVLRLLAIRRGGRDVASGKRELASGKCKFKKIDVTRAARGAIAAGLEVQGIEIDKDGNIKVVTGKVTSTNEHATDFDKWKANNAR